MHSGETWICSGRDGFVLAHIGGRRGCFETSLARTADLHGDGTRDLALSLPGATERAGKARCDDHPGGLVHIRSTRDGALLRTIENPNAGNAEAFGCELGGAVARR